VAIRCGLTVCAINERQKGLKLLSHLFGIFLPTYVLIFYNTDADFQIQKIGIWKTKIS